ncbi:hypothetical protein BU23DRAFT_558232 [Bimuria novae-zelandiae CBS 107.79]|uniref:Heavy metal tolerance protein n=1 Tax=Bimuria novae-zelandiae CBS 107.79 TaxID=1447943 RepID=A0A6A5UUI4_9PLEO|nr:hypothetical protein BU23DRAFT_558232 [Bimuria novae-zelandiae CBS 107.79]
MVTGGGHLLMLRYSSCFIVVACAIFFSTATACFVAPSKRTLLTASQRTMAKHFAAIVCSLHFCEGLLQVFRTVSTDDWSAEPDAVTYTTLNFLLWLVIYLIQADAKRLYRLPNLVTWVLALCIDTVVSLLSFRSGRVVPRGFVQPSIGLLRIASLTILCVSNVTSTTRLPPRDPEREPLLRSSRQHCMGYSPDALEDYKHEEHRSNGNPATLEQEKHVEKLGGWWAYLREVKFLLPYIFPLKDRRRRLYALATLVLMVGGRVSQLIGPRLLGSIVQAISNNHTDGTLSRQILIYVFAVKVPYDVVIEPARHWLSVRLFYGSYLDLMLSLASHVASLSYAFHENKQTGEIVAAIGQGRVINQFVDDFVASTLPLVLDVVVAFAYVTYVFDIYVALILGSTYVFYGLVTYKGTMLCAEARRKNRQTMRVEWNVLTEAISNWMSTFYLNRRESQHIRLKTLGGQELDEAKYAYDVSMSMRTCQTLVTCLGYLGILLRTAHLTTHAENAVGDFVALLFYWGFFTTPLVKLAHFYTSLAQVLVDVERLRQLMQINPTILDDQDAQDLMYREGKIEYRSVSFSYDGKNPVINNLNFIIEPGSTVAFVGQSGSGKTTTCDKLLFRAYDVTEGSVLIDDQDIRGVTQNSLRETVGIVRQEPTFNNDTVLENVRYARLDASDEEVIAACKDAAIHDQIMRFPMGYNTVVGERGNKLSGGERQRLAIAQLFLRDPKIVVLDEATSSVDNVAESMIQESFARICKGRTTVIVAHRLSTVQHANQIFVLHKGRIVERGTHTALLAKHGKYFELWHKTQTVRRLKRNLDQVESKITGTQNHLEIYSDLSEDSDEDHSDCLQDIMQVDGASGSKATQEERTGVRRRICNLKQKNRGGKSKETPEESIEVEEEEEGEEELSPIRVVSPRVTETGSLPSFSRRPSRSRRKSSRARKTSIASAPTPLTENTLRNISAPILPIRVQTQEIWPAYDPVGPVQPPTAVAHESMLRALDETSQLARDVRQPSAASRIPVSTSLLATPVRARQSSVPEMLLQSSQSSQSPTRDMALRSHPIMREEEQEEEESSTGK